MYAIKIAHTGWQMSLGTYAVQAKVSAVAGGTSPLALQITQQLLSAGAKVAAGTGFKQSADLHLT